MKSGARGRLDSRAFDRAFAAVKDLIRQDRSEQALTQLYAMADAEMFPAERRWQCHELIGQLEFWRADLDAALPHLKLAWELPRADHGARLTALSNYLMYLHYADGVTDAALREAHAAYAPLLGDVQQYSHTRRRREKLRIGYLSPNIGDHIVLNFAVQLFSAYDRTRFHVMLYDVGGARSEVTDWAAEMADGYVDLSRSTPQTAAERIYADEIDILFDLAGHSAGGRGLRIAAHRPSPVQLSGIGYFNTTGVPAMDYFLGDAVCDPPEMDALFAERILRLPQTHLCFTPSERFRPYEQLRRTPHETIVFASFNNFAKITDTMLRLWGEILNAVPSAHLLLKNVHPGHGALARMQERTAAAGIDPARVMLRPGTQDYLSDYLDADIILDTYPYPGGGTTCEALCMGLPVVTMAGTRHGARFGASLLANAGLAELVADSPAAYAACAAALAQDRELLTALHTAIPRMMRASPLMDGRGYVRAVETAYEMIWERYLNEEA